MSDAHNQWNNNEANGQQPSQEQYGQPTSNDGQNAGMPPQNEYGQQWNQHNPQDSMDYGYQPGPGAPQGGQYQNGQYQDGEYQGNQYQGGQYQNGPQYPPQQPQQPYQNFPPYAGSYGYPPHNPGQPWNIMSIVGFVVSFLMPPVGLILSIVALVQLHRSRERGQGLAVGGVVLGAIFSLFTVILIGLMLWGISMVGTGEFSYESPSCSGYSCSSNDSGDDSIDSSYLDQAFNTVEIPTAASAATPWR
ncbi:DUF4190 domain-containing protein [Bifidobacterium aquikefiricola]|uniref:DUF4190 domain-containing protein n=1 Tax=Bifidobacterium aquikefiricola TaxID=3059038 RepID=A0AB39U8P2_9BIFI